MKDGNVLGLGPAVEDLLVLLPTRIDVNVSLGDESVAFRCSRCGLLAQATVSGAGTGLKLSGVSLSNAAADARIGAAQAAHLAPCPRCGRRNRAGLAKVLLVGASMGVFAALAAGLVATEQLHGSDPGGYVGMAIALATFLAVVATTTAVKLRSARQRVRFHGLAS
jgi:predicted RNA-binding Zn-ribbon protein involved in translation (DUF1610 family)